MKSIVYQIDNSLSKLIEMKRRFGKMKRRFTKIKRRFARTIRRFIFLKRRFIFAVLFCAKSGA